MSSPQVKRGEHYLAARKQWKAAALMVRDLPDPWMELRFDEIQEETVTRHMYNPHSRKWKTDEVVVKIQSEPFAHGAMRECYRMKKLSKFSQNPNWKNASNYVAKHYMKEVSRETYFEDVKLQMDSKLWGELYSKLDVPKKVDFCQTYVIEFKGREGSPLYGVEHFIDGGYIKYNSNSGFVSDVNRLTPQTFSHFTFEKSNHQLIVVDIQGVGDLYTDPQMHTVDMKDYGEANLGTRGMALFFSSHICSPLCKILGLTQFDLSDEDRDKLLSRRWNFSSSTTRISDMSISDSEDEEKNLTRPSNCSKKKGTIADLYIRLNSAIDAGVLNKMADDMNKKGPFARLSIDSPLPLDSPSMNSPGIVFSVSSPLEDNLKGIGDGDIPKDKSKESKVEDLSRLNISLSDSDRSKGTSASVEKERTRLREEADGAQDRTQNLSILGLIHLDLARYHEMGRFSQDQQPDMVSSMYHLMKSADCGIAESLYTLAHIYLQQPHADFKDLSVEASLEKECLGMEYLVRAAEKGLKPAMLEVAKALDTGVGLGKAPENDADFCGTLRCINWAEAVEWYTKVLAAPDTDTSDSGLVEDPDYAITARMAEMYCNGGNKLDKDPQRAGELYTEAAELAMNAMKGKLSTKYYMLAEEAWSQLPD